jgi:Papain-like cysteine protease AvrRpt2
MTKGKTLILIIIAAFFINANVTCTVNSDPPDFYDDLSIPNYQQEYLNYCGVACVQMWAHYDNLQTITQSQIAAYVGIDPNACSGTDPYELLYAVGAYTLSYGWMENKVLTELGVQGDMIASAIEGICHSVPSIFPLDFCSHAVIARGFEWTENTDGKPLAIRVIFNDPADGRRRDVNASAFMLRYDPDPNTFHYWVILGWEDFVWGGINGHDIFVMLGGTYYGGPSYYNPKNLDLSQLPN